jgi:hypothetical protein
MTKTTAYGNAYGWAQQYVFEDKEMTPVYKDIQNRVKQGKNINDVLNDVTKTYNLDDDQKTILKLASTRNMKDWNEK